MFKEMVATKLTSLQCELGEGILWDENSQCLYWVDILGNKIYQLNIITDTTSFIECEFYPSTIILTTKETLLVTALDTLIEIPIESFRSEDNDRQGIKRYSLADSSKVGGSANRDVTLRFNDGKADQSSRLWLGTMAIEQEKGFEKAGLFKLDLADWINNKKENHLEMISIEDSITISNGMCWDTEKNLFYYIDSTKQRVGRYAWNEVNGTIDFIDFCLMIPKEEGTPDGMTIDALGNLWIAFWGGHQVSCFEPSSGKHLYKVNVKAKNVTCPVFGGPNLTTLYITTAKDDEGFGGEVYFVELDVAGKLSNKVRL